MAISAPRIAALTAYLLATCALLPAAAVAQMPGQIVVDPERPAWFSYHLGGPFFMAGPGDPEDFLYRGSRNADGTRDGDQMELIGKLAPTGANSIYLQAVRSHGGDGDPTHNPFVDGDPELGLSDPILDQWESWFTAMDGAGIAIFFFFYDDSASIWNTGDQVGPEEAAFVTGLVNRFEHHKHLIWVVAEEYQERFSAARVSNLAATIRGADDHHHPIAVHKLSGLDFSEFDDDPWIDQFAIQYNVPGADDLHQGVLIAGDDADGRYNLNLAEAAGWGSGAASRKKAWAVAMAGAYVMVYEMDIAGTSVADLEDLGRLRLFMESTDFDRMEPRPDLAGSGTDYVLAEVGESYIVYADGHSGDLGLQDVVAGSYRLRWLDIVGGGEVVEEVELSAGSQSWARPPGVGGETAVHAVRLDAPNDPPESWYQSLETLTGTPLPVTLAYYDPDGPGPYTFSIVDPPDHGSLSGSGPIVTYVPDPGFTGADAFVWIVNDGLDDSQPATVDIEVLGNLPPTATSFEVQVEAGTPAAVDLAAHAFDPEGEPLTYILVTQPTHGQLTGTGGLRTYTADPGFGGVDSFTWQVSDGHSLSEIATARLLVAAPIFSDDFDRPDSDDVGNGWVEEEAAGETRIDGGGLCFEAQDESILPRVRHAFPRTAAGVLVWSFELHFARTGSEGVYAFRMQLGDGELMAAEGSTDDGVAVNLIWGGPNEGLSGHEGLGWIDGGSVTHLATVSGSHTLTVRADLGARTYAVALDGAELGAGLPFDRDVDLDTVRLFADNLNGDNFAGRSIDDLRIAVTAECAAPDGWELTLSGDVVTGTESWETCSSITAGPDWRVQAGGHATLRSGGRLVLEGGVRVDPGGTLILALDPGL